MNSVFTGDQYTHPAHICLYVHAKGTRAQRTKRDANILNQGRRQEVFCPHCNSNKYTRTDTRYMEDGRVFRWNRCLTCGKKFVSYESYVPDGEEPNPNMFRRNGVKAYRRKNDAVYENDNR